MIEILTDNHYDRIMDLFDSAQSEIIIISPFLSMPMAKKLCDTVVNSSLKCVFVTRFYLEDMFAKSNSIDALELMMNSGIEVYALKQLHTKLYLFDKTSVIAGSANFTVGGLKNNIELSLLATDEFPLIDDFHDYAEALIEQLRNDSNGLITRNMISDARKRYQSLLDSKKAGAQNNYSICMYGADLRSKKMSIDEVIKEVKSGIGNDIMQSVFREVVEEISFDHNIWLKFDGEGTNRIDSEAFFPMVQVELNGKKVFIQNYPFGVGAIKDGDEVYLAAITTDTKGKNQPVIVGRGKMRGYDGDNRVPEKLMDTFDWMERYPFYCITDSVKILDTGVKNGIPLSQVWDALGANTYVASFGRNESLEDVAKKHYQKAHMRLSGNAKVYLDQKMDELEKQYGFKEYISE